MTIDRLTYDEGRCDFDELCASLASVHIERMSRQHVWMSVESAGRRIVLNFHSTRGVSVNVHDESDPTPAAERCKHGNVIDPTGSYVCMKCFNEPASGLETFSEPVEGVVRGSSLEREINRARAEIATWPESVKRAMKIQG